MKTGPGRYWKVEFARAFVNDLGADDITGHEVGGELNALEADTENIGDGLHEKGLCQAGNSDEEAVTVRKEGSDEAFDDFVLTDNDLGEFGGDALGGFLGGGDRGGGVHEREVGEE